MDDPLARLLGLRLHQRDGRRSPHKPLLALMALGRLLSTGSSRILWSEAEGRLADLLAEFGPSSRTSRPQSAAYPFTRLRSDGVWQLSDEVPMDRVGPLRAADPTGSFVPEVERTLLAAPEQACAIARTLVTAHFPESLVVDVLLAAGLDPQAVLTETSPAGARRRRSAAWRYEVVQAWDRQCAFCGDDGQLGQATVGLDAAHVRWFSHAGPDDADNGLALCTLHHVLFDRGVLGLDSDLRVTVSSAYTARTTAGRQVYGLVGRPVRPRRGAPLPAPAHVAWHRQEVFKGVALVA